MKKDFLKLFLSVGVMVFVHAAQAQTFKTQKTYKLKGAGDYSTEEKKSPTSPGGVKFSEAYPEEINNKNYPDILDTFDYPSVEIKDLVKVMSELTGKRFILADKISGKISIVAPGPITVAEAYKAFLSALQMNDLTVVPSGKFLKIVKSRDATKSSIETYVGDYFPNSDQMITKVLKLKYIPVKELDKALRALYSKDGDLKIYEPTNSIILSDYGSNVEKIVGLLKEMDVPGFEEKMEVIKIKYAKAKDIADLINKIINKGESKSNVPRFRRNKENNKGTGAVSLSYVTADERTNSVIALGNTLGVQKARELVRTLDFKLEGDEEGGVQVYYVKHNDAEELAKTLGGLADDSKKAQQESSKRSGTSAVNLPSSAAPKTAAQIFGSEVSVKADKTTNSLLITASSQDYKKVLGILKKIDIPRDQVFVETVIMEVNADNRRDIGLDIANITPAGKADVGNPATSFAVQGMFGNEKGGLKDFLVNPISALSGGILSFGFGEEKTVQIGTETKTIKSVLGLVKLLQTYEVGNVLSTPKLMALDNEEATLEVGQDIVVGNQIVNSAAGTQTQSVQRKSVSSSLTITPSISPSSNAVRLKLKQTVKDARDVSNANTPIDEKLLETNIVVPNGDTAVLGGMVSEKVARKTTKVPLLGDIPILGWLFRSKSKSVVKSNLMLFITPKIIRNPAQNKELLRSQLEKRLKFIKRNMKGVDPHGEKIDEISKIKEDSDDLSWKEETPEDLKEFPATDSL